MGIKFRCPNGHKLHVKSFLAGKRGICPHCGVKVRIPEASVTADEADDSPESDASIEGGVGTVVVTAPAKSIAETAATTNAVTRPAVANAAPVATASAVPATPVSVTPSVTSVPAPAATPTPVTPVVAAAPVTAEKAPNAVWYVRPPSGGQFGPARGDVMRKWIGEGRVSADSLVWRDGWADWKTASVVFPSLAPATPLLEKAVAVPGASASSMATASASRALRAKKRSNGFAIGMVVTLGLVALVLLAVFIFVLTGLNPS